MSSHLELATLTTELVSVLATQTGLSVGDGASPVVGEPGLTDYPYVVVYEIADLEAVEMLGSKSTVNAQYQLTCVGRTRLQAGRARDFCRVILDPAIAVETATARMLLRWTVSSIMQPSDSGNVWSAIWRFESIVTAV